MPRSSWLEKIVSLSVFLAPALAACSFGGSDGDGGDEDVCDFAFTKLCGLSFKGPRTFSAGMSPLDTSKDSNCTKVIPANETTGAPELCVLSATTIEIGDGATLRATGKRPLVLAASENIRIRGTLDVSSTRARTAAEGDAAESLGAGGESTCTPFQRAVANSMGGGSGGAGGSFAGRGGGGGDGNSGTGGFVGGLTNPPVDTDTLTSLRGGCRGQSGGTSDNNPNGGLPGLGGLPGGVVYLASRGTILILQSGKISANGSGGGGGGAQAGGGGGGSGGLIVLEALTSVTHTGLLTANGGGGGGGGQYNGVLQLSGTPGSDGQTAEMSAAGGGGQPNIDGGDGGRGAANGYADAMIGRGSQHGGGGGGGGVGWIHVITPTSDNRGKASPPTQ